MAELSLLNVGTGDTKISFDPDGDPKDLENAAALVRDMIRRGYVILVEVDKDDKGPLYRRVLDFDDMTHEYIVAGLPEDMLDDPKEEAVAPTGRKPARGKRGAYRRRVSAKSASAVAVPRTAGG